MNLPNISKNRNTLSDHAYQVIRGAIVTLQLEPGQLVFESELGSTLGVSRTPIREAFRRLMTEELIEILPQRGARIAYMSKKKIEEARFVRVSLEVSAFKEAARKWNANDAAFEKGYQQIRGILEEHRKIIDEQNFDRFLELDESFHSAVLELTGNSTLISIINQMRGHLNRMRYLELLETKHMKQLVSEHEAIFEAITVNDEEKTERLIREHITSLEYCTPDLVKKYSHYFQSVE
ncbi:GntR family transcriptional regulator [Paenibacillus sp. TH7-28]